MPSPEVRGWLSLATSGYKWNQPFDAVVLRPDEGDREVPLGGWVAQKDHKRVVRDAISAGWPDQVPGWPASLEGGGGAPRWRSGSQCQATPGPARRSHRLALPPEEPPATRAWNRFFRYCQ